MVSIATGVLCAVCSVTSYLIGAKFRRHVQPLIAPSFADAETVNCFALTTDELSDHHYAKPKGFWRAVNVEG